jgi:gliding motility-associated-like protein
VPNFTPQISFNDSLVHTTCNAKNGSIYIKSVNGGTGPYNFLWQNGETTQNIFNLSSGGYLLKVTDANNCPAQKKFYLTNNNNIPMLNYKRDVKCNQPTGFATAVVLGGTPPLSYTWSNGQNTPTASGLVSGTYSVLVKDALGCTTSSSVTINNTDDVFQGSAVMEPKLPLTGDPVTISMFTDTIWKLDFAGLSNGTMVYAMNNQFNFSEYGNYNITYYFTSTNGCKASYTYDFFIKDYMTLYFPNTFTPDGNNVNDMYRPEGTLVKDFKMEIFDRWGTLVFKTDDLRKGWDGRINGAEAKQDVYVYKAWALDLFSKQHNFTGHINLIR